MSTDARARRSWVVTIGALALAVTLGFSAVRIDDAPRHLRDETTSRLLEIQSAGRAVREEALRLRLGLSLDYDRIEGDVGDWLALAQDVVESLEAGDSDPARRELLDRLRSYAHNVGGVRDQYVGLSLLRQ